LRGQSRAGDVSTAKLMALVIIIALPLTIIESLFFRRVVLLEPFGDILPRLMHALHLG
jgi:hypothetical protein